MTQYEDEQIQIQDKTYKVTLTEEEVKLALQEYVNQRGCTGEVSCVTYNHGSRTEEYGIIEIDVEYKEGVELTVVGE